MVEEIMNYKNLFGEIVEFAGEPRKTRGDYGADLHRGVLDSLGDVWFWDPDFGWMSENMSEEWRKTGKKKEPRQNSSAKPITETDRALIINALQYLCNTITYGIDPETSEAQRKKAIDLISQLSG